MGWAPFPSARAPAQPLVPSHSWASQGTWPAQSVSLCLGEARPPGGSRGQNPSLLDLSVGQRPPPGRLGGGCLRAGGLCARRSAVPRARLHRGVSRAPGPALREIDAAKRAFNGLIDRRPLSCSNTRFLPGEAASPILSRSMAAAPASWPRVSSASHRQKSISAARKLRRLATFLLSGRLKQGIGGAGGAARARVETPGCAHGQGEAAARRAKPIAGGGTASEGGGRPRGEGSLRSKAARPTRQLWAPDPYWGALLCSLDKDIGRVPGLQARRAGSRGARRASGVPARVVASCMRQY